MFSSYFFSNVLIHRCLHCFDMYFTYALHEMLSMTIYWRAEIQRTCWNSSSLFCFFFASDDSEGQNVIMEIEKRTFSIVSEDRSHITLVAPEPEEYHQWFLGLTFLSSIEVCYFFSMISFIIIIWKWCGQVPSTSFINLCILSPFCIDELSTSVFFFRFLFIFIYVSFFWFLYNQCKPRDSRWWVWILVKKLTILCVDLVVICEESVDEKLVKEVLRKCLLAWYVAFTFRFLCTPYVVW